MKSSKKIVSLSLAATMLATSTGAFAMPNDTIVIGDKAFEVFDLAKDGLQEEINGALNDYNNSEDANIIYSLDGFKDGEFVNLSDDASVSKEKLTKLKNVKLYDENGNTIEFANFEDEKGNADAKDKETLQQLINNGNVDTLKLMADVELEEALDVTQLVNLDLNGHTLKGDLVVKSEAEGNMSLKGAENSVIDGNLTINTKDADFVVGENTTIKGKTTIEDVKGSTFVNKGTLAEVVIEDPNGAGFQNDGAVEVVEVNTKAKVVLKGEKKITKLKVEMEGAHIDLAVDVADVVADKAFEMVKKGDVKIEKLEGAEKNHMEVKDEAGNVVNVDDIVKPDGGNTGGSTGGGSVLPPVDKEKQTTVLPTSLAVNFTENMQSVSVEDASIVSVTLKDDLKENVSFTVYESGESTTKFVYTNAGWKKGDKAYKDNDGSNLTVTFSGMDVTKVQEGNLGEVGSMNIAVAKEAQSVSYEVYTEDGNTTTYVYGASGWTIDKN